MCRLVIPLMALAFAFPTAATAQASPEEQAVLATVERLFAAMAAHDTAAAREILLPEGSLTSVTTRNGSTSYSVTSHDQFIAQLAGGTEPWKERIWDARVEVHGAIAMVWAPYDFHRGDTFSHCGVDAVSLIRTDEGWRMAWTIYTVEREGCTPPGG